MWLVGGVRVRSLRVSLSSWYRPAIPFSIYTYKDCSVISARLRRSVQLTSASNFLAGIWTECFLQVRELALKFELNPAQVFVCLAREPVFRISLRANRGAEFEQEYLLRVLKRDAVIYDWPMREKPFSQNTRNRDACRSIHKTRFN